ncbi:MAG: acyltransferase [Pedobacter sp.]|nr:MAG: acyltransferase [Pedobacter sp.]
MRLKRLHNLDYLRGLTSLGIMIFHYLTWNYGEFSAENILGRIGLYGVSIFYCLSGLTLFTVYYDGMTPTFNEVGIFLRRRIFRIFPLLWLATFLTIILSALQFNIILIILNLTGIFGFIKWHAYLATGAWSIGNELVFYVFFPIFILLSKRYRALFYIFCFLLFGIYCVFAFGIIKNTESIELQWKNYVNPLNQVFLFLGGFLLGFIFKSVKTPNSINIAIISLSLLLFIFYPVSGNTVNLITGFNRLIFTFISLAICFGFYKLSVELPKFIHKPLTILGESSYSVYLLHPIVYLAIMPFFKSHLPYFNVVGLGFLIIISLLLSYYIYQYVEKYFIKMARK